MMSFSDLILNHTQYKHHALLLVSRQFEHTEMSPDQLASLALSFCGIHLQNTHDCTAFDAAKHHPDVFVADRQKKILTLSDLEQIKELAMYPPAVGSKRLFLIESCQRINVNAANALLKILEEPLTSLLFVLTTSHLLAVLPTIASRMQKIFLTLNASAPRDIRSVFSAEDLDWLERHVEKFSLHAFRPFLSLSERKPTLLPSSFVKEIIERADRLSKEHTATELCDLLTVLISAQVQKNPSFLSTAKMVFAALSQWKESAAFHPSTQFWLTRIFLSFS